MTNVYIEGIGMTKFGKFVDKSMKQLLVEASIEALEDAGNPKVDAVFVGNFMGGSIGNQEILGALVANELGLGHIPTAKVEGACASGGIALRQGIMGILSGEYDTVLIAGVEKMKHASTADVTQAINAAMDNESNEKQAGLTFPGFFGVLANRYFYETDATKEHLAMIALKNRENALHNPLAQFQKPTTMEEIMEARIITSPLGLFDCSPTTDGAAALVITREKGAIHIRSSAQSSGPTQMQDADDLLSLPAVRESGRLAYEKAGVGPEDIDVVEIHDCFSMTEMLAIEELGFFNKREGWLAVEQGRTKATGDKPVNTSGGLLSRGHPIGATGVAQMYQLVQQLRGTAPNQVENARLALAQNLGGTGSYSTVHILERL
ncbi:MULTISPECIES: thiolase domain-containing protein [unclassified Sporosarcina]|uniref:thiolase domain-containing protein n=1 Tax=unclassified Sporosarcina TaxID=2647733 RepID=UPI000C163E11|nr:MULTISPECIES: thiolase domain-containing protein [unclassified Sporosarcina]PIC99458.1 acetyl-CoA acetyltransferase [Sporosarcina sp. P29]PID06225.1 acetyl-CoA acetyltransferase [Sporosarcina sp. P30]PID09419.1 acetyl-CoA acetyltransferase [Sporosarcina sp. P31]PID12717.1 acetyl-CoA acetyltransferase [Sporosarcina sp. P32b]